MDMENIHELKYNEMQKLAKQVGIKANMKFDRLKTALIEYHQKQEDKENKSETENVKSSIQEIDESKSEDKTVDEESKTEVVTSAPKGRRKLKTKRTTKSKTKQSKKSDKTIEEVIPSSETEENKQKTQVESKMNKIESKQDVTKNKYTPLAVKNKQQNPSSSKLTPIAVKNKQQNTHQNSSGSRYTPLAVRNKQQNTPQTSSDSKYTPLAVRNKQQNTPPTSKYTPLAVRNKQLATPQGSSQKRKLSKTPVQDEQPAKRTRTSFEKSELPAEPSPRPSSRRSTYSVEKVKNKDKTETTSPGVGDLVNSMDVQKSDEEMKQNLIQALDKKVQGKVQSLPKQEKVGVSTQIPRFAAFLEKKRQQQNKPITPGNKDWTKIHQKEFEKFDSIDVYLEKKRKNREETNMSVKKARLLVEQTKEAIKRLQNHKTPAKGNKPRISKGPITSKTPSKDGFKPSVFSTKQMNLNFSQTRKSPRSSGSVFKPSVTSTDKMNLNFSEMKTPTNCTTQTPRTNPRKSTGSMSQRKSFATPFKFSATLNNTIDASRSIKKPSFDLKASLSRPMTWKSHKGKLKSVAESYINNSAKSNKTQPREERRISAMNKRSDIKSMNEMARRGITS